VLPVLFVIAAVGALPSTTVTTAVHSAIFPDLSVTVSFTLLVPMSVQVKLVWLNSRDCIPQLSLEPLLMSDTSKIPLPYNI
jgi:hypothetical protein